MQKRLIAGLVILFLAWSIVPQAFSGEVKQGDEITIITLGTMACLCPYPNCGQNQHITRIPKGTVLNVEGINEVKVGRGKYATIVKWFEVTYKGKRGWISIYNTDKAQ